MSRLVLSSPSSRLEATRGDARAMIMTGLQGSSACSRECGSSLTPPHRVELAVRTHAGEIRHAVGEVEEGGDGADVPDVGLVEAVAAKLVEIRGLDRRRVGRHL